jgi:hypothetical protein
MHIKHQVHIGRASAYKLSNLKRHPCTGMMSMCNVFVRTLL